MSNKKYSRRNFLGTASCAALGSTTILSTLFNLKMANAATAVNSSIMGGGNYKALVCILLGGGNDSFNMLVPTDSSEYNIYAQTRSNLALAQNSLLSLNGTTTAGQNIGLHPSMSGVQTLFNQNKLSFIGNVGTLVQPITKTQYENNAIPIPLGLYSHSDQMQQWQTSVPNSRSAIGWGGKTADLLSNLNTNQNISMNISLSGSNTFQAGNNTIEFVVEPTGSIGIYGYGETDSWNQRRTTAVNSLIEHQYQDVLKQSYANTIKNAQNAHDSFSTVVGNVPAFTTTFSENQISKSMEMIAKVIAARNELGMCRQTFFVNFDGWDHHDEVLNAQSLMLGTLSTAMKEFYDALEELGVQNDVTTFSASDFARTLTSNGNGSDHGWGGHCMVMGGSVDGGRFFGDYPSLALNGNLIVDEAAVLPTLSTDEYFAELALWFGVAPSDLNLVLPNIGNFYSIGSGNPIGFMG